MTSIESLGYPIGYKAKYEDAWPSIHAGNIAIRTEARALTGMQKEALVYYSPTKSVWRMVSDEGPYLNGTDLAPFPLAYYGSGMAFSFVAEFLKHARENGINIDDVELEQDNFYTMEGSALRGDMIGGSLPSKLVLTVKSDADAELLEKLALDASSSSPAQDYMCTKHTNVFSLSHNGTQADVTRIAPSTDTKSDPVDRFDTAPPVENNPRDDMVIKLEAAETVFGVSGGAGSSLHSEQRRTLHVRTIVTKREDGLFEARVQLFKPIGSSFRFLCDIENGETASAQAPPPLAYLSAGVAFCFMTQVGRYATIVKQELKNYRVVQDTIFNFDKGVAMAEPVDTHLFVDTDEPVEASQKLLSISEQTCFLHAAMRSEVPSEVQLQTS